MSEEIKELKGSANRINELSERILDVVNEYTEEQEGEIYRSEVYAALTNNLYSLIKHDVKETFKENEK